MATRSANKIKRTSLDLIIYSGNVLSDHAQREQIDPGKEEQDCHNGWPASDRIIVEHMFDHDEHAIDERTDRNQESNDANCTQRPGGKRSQTGGCQTPEIARVKRTFSAHAALRHINNGF